MLVGIMFFFLRTAAFKANLCWDLVRLHQLILNGHCNYEIIEVKEVQCRMKKFAFVFGCCSKNNNVLFHCIGILLIGIQIFKCVNAYTYTHLTKRGKKICNMFDVVGNSVNAFCLICYVFLILVYFR